MKENGRDNNQENRITKDTFIAVGFHIWRQFDDTYYAGFAASVAYFFFMSSMPTMIVLTQILGIFDVSLDFIMDWLITHTNEQITNLVSGLFTTNSVRFTNIVLVFVALWAASGLEFSLSRLMSHILTEGQYRFNFFVERVKVIPTAIVTMVAVAFTLIVYVYGNNMFQRFVKGFVLFRVLLALRLPIVIGLFFAMILMNYAILPRIRVPIKTMVPGAIVATIGILIITTFYGIYIGQVANYNILYGSFANFVALMLWFYLLAWVLCIGAMFNKAWDEVRGNGMLTHDKMMEYLDRQTKPDADVEHMFVSEDDKYNPETESIAVKMSRKYVKGYDEMLRHEKEEIDIKRREQMHIEDMYEDYLSE